MQPIALDLADPAWLAVLVGVVAIVVGAGVAFAVARWQRGPKPVTALGYRVVRSSLVSSGAAGRVTILYEDQPLRAGALFSITIRNTGNQPIQPADFDGPLRIEFSGDVRLLDVSIADRQPSSLAPTVKVPVSAQAKVAKGAPTPESPRIEIEPLLLNADASVTLEVLADGYGARSGRATLSANVARLKQVDQLDDHERGTASRSRARGAVATTFSGLVAALVTATSGLGVSALVGNESDTTIRLNNGEVICASEYRLSADRVVAVEADGGRLRDLQSSQVRSIKKRDC